MTSFGQRLQAAWRHRGPVALGLLPFSLLYGALWRLREAGYGTGLLHSVRLPVPVVVVGNVIVGGAGKTPTVIALLQHLRQRGIAAGVVSRGYGRTLPTDDDGAGLEVSSDSDPASVGDEPLLIKRHTGAPVFVGRRRPAVAARLLAAHPDVQVLVCDDGLQHTALIRDIEICVFDDRGIGNGWLLPAGPLREPWPRAVDLVLYTGRANPPALPGFRGIRQLADEAVDATGRTVLLTSLAKPTTRLAAIAGIARPEAFFEMLRERGLTLAETHALPDHADFMAGLPSFAPGTVLLCTEKDAAKLWRVRPDALAVPLRFTLPKDFTQAFDRLVDARLSSASRAS